MKQNDLGKLASIVTDELKTGDDTERVNYCELIIDNY